MTYDAMTRMSLARVYPMEYDGPDRATLKRMPREVLHLIVKSLKPGDVRSLSLVCKLLRKGCRSYLWCSLVVKPESQYKVDRIPMALPQRIKLRFVHQLHLRLDRADLVDPRCLHWVVPPCEDENRLSALTADCPSPEVRMENLVRRVLALLSRFRRDQLLSFSWELGTCLPIQVLQRVADKHDGLLSLRLATDSHCVDFPDPDPLASVKFKDIETFAWSGVTDLFAVSCFLYRHQKSLQNVELAMTSFATFERDTQKVVSDGFTNHIWEETRLPPAPGQVMHTLTLHWVQNLTLSSVPLAEKFLTTIFDLGRLQSLTLRGCPGWDKALSWVTKSYEGPMALKSLEIQSMRETWRDEGVVGGQWGWEAFFKRTVHLTKLYLGLEVLREEKAAQLIWSNIDFLLDRLVELVVHFVQRSAFLWWPGEFCTFDDKGAGIFSRRTGLLAWNPFNQSMLQSLGISCTPKNLMTLLRPFTQTSSLRFLHVRQTECDVEHQGSYCYANAAETQAGARLRPAFVELANWLFGPQGIRSLQTLAFGDFASNRPSPGHSLFLVRDHGQSRGYSIIQPESDKGRRLLAKSDGYSRMLSACPVLKSIKPQRVQVMTERRQQIPPGFYEEYDFEVDLQTDSEGGETEPDIPTLRTMTGLETPIRRYLRIRDGHVEKRRKMNGGFLHH
ncbi:hypothetical protein CP533_1634 [Ophiocordyceps camponoti-saundersi (nom. inval.)]|nr:hypothetical protein CP533_1634 [Ophiocordyceps camponoti-saundersi (nom. inval.)]